MAGTKISAMTDGVAPQTGDKAPFARAGANVYLSTDELFGKPMALGGTTPAAGAFTTLSASGALSGNLTPPVYGRVVRVAGNVTTTSTSLVDLTGATVTLTTGANPAQVNFTCTTEQSAANNSNFFNIAVDGALELGTSGIRQALEGTGVLKAFSIAHQTAPLTAGAHTIKIQWMVDAGTGTVDASSTTACSFSVSEIR